MKALTRSTDAKGDTFVEYDDGTKLVILHTEQFVKVFLPVPEMSPKEWPHALSVAIPVAA